MKYYFYKDLKLSALCLGCAQFGQKYGIGNKKILKEKKIKLIIRKAVNSGINFFDTAADYGKSERILGKYLAPFKNKDLVIATKIKYLNEGRVNKNIIRKTIKDSLESSFKKLQRNHLDIVYIHQHQLFFKFPEIFLKVLGEYKKNGFIRYIGISLYEPEEVNKALKYNEIDIFQIPYNALNRSFEKNGKIRLLKKQEKLITLRSIFLQGLFFMEPGNLSEFFKPIKETLKFFYERIKKHFHLKEEFFLGYVLEKNYGPVILGIYSLPQLISNLNILNSVPDESRFKAIVKKIPNLNNIYIDPRQWNLK